MATDRLKNNCPIASNNTVKKLFTVSPSRFGIIASLVPVIIFPYYITIGGWVVKYFLAFLTGKGTEAAQDGYFTGFITSDIEPVILMLIFLAVTAFIVFRGVNKGIESFSKIIMPLLIILVIGIAIFSITIKKTGDDGIVRTGVEGLKLYLIPNLDRLTVSLEGE